MIVEVGGNSLEVAYRPFNPGVQYFQLDGAEIDAPLPGKKIDCVVISDPGGLAPGLPQWLSRLVQRLSPDGQVLVLFNNAQHWRRMTDLLLGRSDNKTCFTLAQLRQMFADAGLVPDEPFRDKTPLPAEQQSAFEGFQRQIAPVLRGLDVDQAEFQMVSRAAEMVLRGFRGPDKGAKLLLQTCIVVSVACDRVRVLEPDRFTATLRGTRVMSGRSHRLNVATPDEGKVFVWQRALLKYPDDFAKQKRLLQNGYLIVAEHDDDPYHWPKNSENRFLVFWSSHCIQTSTEPLAEHLKQLGNRFVKAFQNQLAYLPAARVYANSDTVTLFFGALNRQQDWGPIMPALNEVLLRHPQVFVKVIHDRSFFDALATSRKEFHKFLPYDAYQDILHECDIGILPLQDTQFNRMKSDLKFIEHAGHGVVALASPTVYKNSIEEGETGMIYRSPAEFGEKLSELIRNRDLRHGIARRAYAFVLQNRLLCQHFKERREWYLEMLARLPELDAALRERCRQMFDR